MGLRDQIQADRLASTTESSLGPIFFSFLDTGTHDSQVSPICYLAEDDLKPILLLGFQMHTVTALKYSF